MMPAAKMMDPVMGVDIHIIQPPGPVPPVPIPHPFVGMLFDPMELAPFIGASVFVNGMPKATAGSEGKALPPHIPIGGVFVPPPPGNECEMFMGSATVLFEGEPASYMALPALSCQSVGMPSPPRAKKKPKPILKLPTSVVLPIPAGPPVLIGGPPTVSMTVIGMKVAMGALGKAAKKLKKAMQASKKAKKVSNRIHKAARKAMDRLGVPPSVRNKVHKSICTATGHPVDVATGKVFTDSVDFELPGPIPLRWERTWFSTSVYDGPLGHGWHHSYDLALVEDGSAVAVRMADGRPIAFPRLAAGQEHFDRAEKLTLAKDDRGYFVRTRDRLHYRFRPLQPGSEVHLLESIYTESGHSIRFAYDAESRLHAIKDSSGRVLRIARGPEGRIASILAPHPDEEGRTLALVSYAYGMDGNLVEARDSLGNAWTFRYRNRLLIRETNRNGLSFHFEYDADGPSARCVRTWGDGGIYERRLAYDASAGMTAETDSLGAKKVYHVADSGLVHRTEDALGHATSTAFNAWNEPLEETDELGRVTAYEYDERGNCTKVVRPDGSTLEFGYREDDPIWYKDALGGVWTYEVDECHRLLKQVDPAGHAIEYRYEGRNLASVRNAAGAETILAFGEDNLLRSLTTASGLETRFEYDRLGRCLSTHDTTGSVLRKAYDSAGQVRSLVNPDGTLAEFDYDPEGNVVRAKHGGREAWFRYRGMNRLAGRQENGVKVDFMYDTEERLVGLRNERGLIYGFRRGPRGDVEAEVGYDGLERTYVRDARGRVLQVLRAGGAATEYAYDAADRILQVLHSDGGKEEYKYRPDGEMVEASNSATTVVFERDGLGRVTREFQGKDWIASEYDPAGRRIRMHSSRKVWVSTSRNSMGDVVEIRAGEDGGPEGGLWSAAFVRDMAGMEIERCLPGGLNVAWTRDRSGRPLRQLIKTSTERRVREYRWDPEGRLGSLLDSAHGTFLFGHDPFGNLAWTKGPDGAYLFRMPDVLGNLFRSEGRDDRTYGPSGQLLESRDGKGTTRYEYDAEGNLIRKLEPGGREWRYEWNAAGMLANVVRPDGEMVEFAYDPLGRRVSKKFKGRLRRWIWDGNNPLHEWVEPEQDPVSAPPADIDGPGAIEGMADRRKQERKGAPANAPPSDAETDGDGPITWLFEPGTFTPMAKHAGGAWHSIVADHAGVPLAMFDGQGRETWSALLDSDGAVAACKGRRDDCPFRLRGQYEDPETGLHYNRFRYYDPASGSYISQDPLGQLSRLYAYVGDPLLSSDPLGLYEWVDPNSLNYSQAYVEGDTLDYERDMKNGDWDWNRTSRKGNNVAVLNVVEVDGQLVSMDNRRLLAAQNAGLDKVPINKVNLDDIKPGTSITWRESLRRRLNSKPPGSNLPKVQLPPQGTKTKPTVVKHCT